MVDERRLPFGGAHPVSRADFQQALLDLCAPFREPADFARRLDATAHPAAVYPPRVARLELTSRLLWGLAPLAAGGGAYPGWALIREEIARGTDPKDPGYWGAPTDIDQRIVESAALGLALALAPGELWEPLTPSQRAHFAHWLRTAASARAVENNWRLFATLVDLGLASVGEARDPAIAAAAFKRITAFHHGSGWYSDGDPGNPFDYYSPWAIHFYCLVNAGRGAVDEETGAWIRERARRFAPEFAHWFAADGAALPFGRSLTYRFAQSSFFGALAFAGETGDGLSWGQLRGLWARNLRWWGRQPVLGGDGTLSIGYAYPSLLMSESYNAPGSPYWAFKAFLPLALPAEHPFWTAAEEPMPEPEPVHEQSPAGFLLQRDRNGQVIALSSAPGGRWARHGEAKYGKFAYSTAFGFSVPSRAVELAGAGGDSMLLLSEDGRHWRAREENEETWPIEGAGVLAAWRAWPDVSVETLLLPFGSDGRWHVRAHRIVTARELWSAEGGFCVPLDDVEFADATAEDAAGPEGSAFAASGNPSRCSGIRDLSGTRQGEVVRQDPNTHLLWPRTLLPVLRGKLEPGEHWLVTAVYADSGGDASGFADGPTPDRLGALGLPPEALEAPSAPDPAPARRPRTLLAMSPRVAEDAIGAYGLERFAQVVDLVPGVVADDFDEPDAAAALADAEILVTHWGCPVLDADVLARAPRLRAVVHVAGSVKHFVTEACWERGIAVSSAAGANALPVAEYTIAAIIFANKRILHMREQYRAERDRSGGFTLDYPDAGNYRRRIGVVGASIIGRRVLELLRPFDFELLVYDPFLSEHDAAELGARLVGMDELCAESDVVTLHAPQIPETRHMLDRRRLALIRDGATVINTARGSLVDGDALTRELVDGRLHAVIDVTEPEVLPADSVLYDLPNVLLTPHVAGSVGNELHRLVDTAADELARYASGAGFAHPVLRRDLGRRA